MLIFQIIPYSLIILITFFTIFPNNLYWGYMIKNNFSANTSYKLYIIESTGSILSGIIFYMLIYIFPSLFIFNIFIIISLILFIFLINKNYRITIINIIILLSISYIIYPVKNAIIQTPYSNIIKITHNAKSISYYNNKNFITINEYNPNDFIWIDFCLSSKPNIQNIYISGIQNPYLLKHLSNFDINKIIINETDPQKLHFLLKELNINKNKNIKIYTTPLPKIDKIINKEKMDITLININDINNIENFLLLKKIIIKLARSKQTINFIKIPLEENYLSDIKKAFLQNLIQYIKKYYKHIHFINFDFFIIEFTNNKNFKFSSDIFASNFQHNTINQNLKTYLLYNIIFHSQRNKEILDIIESSHKYNFSIKKFIQERNKIYGIFYEILINNSLLIISFLILLYFYNIINFIKTNKKEIYYFIFSSISFSIFILSLIIYKKNNGAIVKDIALINTSFFIGLFLALILQKIKYPKIIFINIFFCLLSFMVFFKIEPSLIYFFLFLWGIIHGQIYNFIDNKIQTNKITIFSEDYKGTIFSSLIISFGLIYILEFNIDYIIILLFLILIPIISYKLLK